jgi:glucose dehydrogenase
MLLIAGCHQTHPGLSAGQPGGSLQQYAGQLEKDDGQWLRATKDYANTRFSSLDQINQSNVAQLRPAFTFSTGVDRGQEAAPIVANGTMYIATPWPNVLYALDLAKPGAPLHAKISSLIAGVKGLEPLPDQNVFSRSSVERFPGHLA